MSVTAVSEIAAAIKEGFKVLGQYLSGKELARLKYQLEAAQSYIFVNERSGEYKDVKPARAEELLAHFRKRVFDSA